MLPYKVHLRRLISFSCHLDTTIQQVHLVDEQVTEHSRTRHNNVNTRTAKLLQRNQLNLVHTTNRVSNWTNTYKSKHLRKRLSVRLDVVCTPQSKRNTLGECTIILLSKLLQQLFHNLLRYLNSCSRWDRRRIQRVHVTTSWKNIGVSDRIATRSRHQKLSVQKLHNSRKLVVRYYLLQAELQVRNHRSKTLFLHTRETSFNNCLRPGLLLSHHITKECTHLVKRTLHLLHTTTRIG
mmetsp:Transcript_22602/g.33636  ORF Transcript_22602/g.33636 Transcript_22602/m.33636 type:complete len:237 (+) Transcript_22602:931-1641(+)